MTGEDVPADRAVRPEVAQCLDKICDRFEADWNAGWRPRIEDFLGDVAEPERSVLLRDLLQLEIQIRRRNGESPKQDRYEKRFPEHRRLVDDVFRARSEPAAEPAAVVRTVVTEPVETHRAAEPAAPAAPASKRLGRFELLEVLGEGAFGTVYRARDPQLDRDVALKVPRSGVLVEDRDVARFLREAKAAAQLRHPHIVAVHEAGRADHTYYIASAFVPGTTLRQALKAEPRFGHDQAARLMSQLASALHYAHTKGVIHRDVKPANIMLDEQGEPHIMDFGLARRTDGDALRTLEGVRLGTPAYMSPEQAQGQSHQADPRSDIWSLGVILYELLTGCRPFQGNESEVLLAVRVRDPEPLRKLDSSIPRDLETICLKCLAKDRKDRYASAQRVAEELERWRRGEPIEARPIGLPERAWRWTKANPVLAGVSGTLAVLLVAVAAGATLVAANLADLQSRTAQALTTAREETLRAEREKERAEHEAERAREAQLRVEEALGAIEAADAARLAADRAAEAEKKRAALAKIESDQAKSLAQDATTAKDAAIKSTTWAAYANQIELAERELRLGNQEVAHALLLECPRQFCAWEWNFLNRWAAAGTDAKYTTDRLHSVRIEAIAYSPGGKLMATVSRNGELKVIDAASREVKYSFSVGSSMFRTLQFSPDGQTLASLNVQSLGIWGAETGQPINAAKLRNTGGGFTFTPDSKFIVYGESKSFMAFELATGEQQPLSLPQPGDQIPLFPSSIAFGPRHTPAEGFSAIESSNRELRIFNSGNGSWGTRWQVAALGTAIFSSKGTLAVVVPSGTARNDSVGLLDVKLDTITRLGDERTGSISELRFSSDGTLLACLAAGRIRVWDAVSKSELYVLASPRGPITALDWKWGTHDLTTGFDDGTVQFWKDLQQQQTPRLLRKHVGAILDMGFTADGSRLISGGIDGSVRYWDPLTGQESNAAILKGHTFAMPQQKTKMRSLSMTAQAPLALLGLSPSSDLVVARGDDHILRLRHAQSGELTGRTIQTPKGTTRSALFSPDGRIVATCEADQKIRFWSAATGREQFEPIVADAEVLSIAFSQAGNLVAFARADHEIRIHDLGADATVKRLNGHAGRVNALRFSQDGSLLVTGSDDETIRVWEIRTGKQVQAIKDEYGAVMSVAISADNRRVASCGYGSKVRLWDLETGRKLLALEGHSGIVRRVEFSPDGALLASADSLGTIAIWDGRLPSPESDQDSPR